MLEKFISAIPSAASSPYAFAAYISLLGTFLYVTIAQYKLKTISKIIRDIPEQDRGALIAREYSTMPRDGLSAEQWLRSRRMNLATLLLSMTIIVAAVIIIIALQTAATQSTSSIQREQNLTREWKARAEALEQKLAEASIPAEELRKIQLDMQVIRQKLSDTKAATEQYKSVADATKDELRSNPDTMQRNLREEAILALDRGTPSVARQIFKQAAAADLDTAADNLFRAAKLAEQEANFQEANELYRQAHTLRPTNVNYSIALAESYFLLSDYKNALQNFESSLHSIESSSQPDENILLRLNLSLADVHHALGNFKEAEDRYISIEQKYNQSSLSEGEDYSRFLNNFASLMQDQRKFSKSEDYYNRALSGFIRIFGNDDPNVASCLNNIAFLRVEQRYMEGVEGLLREAARIFRERLGPTHSKMIPPLNNLARFYIISKNYKEADDLLSESHKIGLDRYGGMHPIHARTEDLYSEMYLAVDENEKACDHAKKAITIKEKILGSNHIEVAYSMSHLGLCEIKLGNLANAKIVLENAIAISKSVNNGNTTVFATVQIDMGLLYSAGGNKDKARETLYHGLQIRRNLLGSTHPATQEVEEILGAL